jgi:hypothetical protein
LKEENIYLEDQSGEGNHRHRPIMEGNVEICFRKIVKVAL